MTVTKTTESTIASLVTAALYEIEMGDATDVRRVVSFEDEGVMTTNTGLVVYMDDGTEFQLTIVQSR